jgi:hypothetical protein
VTNSGITATVDRFEGPDKKVAVLVEDAGSVEGSRTGAGVKVDVERSLLPQGAGEGEVIRLSRSLGDGDPDTVHAALEGAWLDHHATDERQKRVEERLERLKQPESRGERP